MATHAKTKKPVVVAAPAVPDAALLGDAPEAKPVEGDIHPEFADAAAAVVEPVAEIAPVEPVADAQPEPAAPIDPAPEPVVEPVQPAKLTIRKKDEDVLFVTRDPEDHVFSIQVANQMIRGKVAEGGRLSWAVPAVLAKRFEQHAFVVNGRIERSKA